ncbi:uncharacterized protein LOC117239044 isoform X3 [Bombus vosnesenskii]|uniref:Uncharacterized protein LOC117239044 isoform X3 n=1 Tax=Bombus vosnesenskii TaxID=207650 RepID=A0A6J3L6Q3_9HYME|nr:uncharacterized protein LOC117239044 isoform X3 [Bombus vosnesenskii]
MVDLEVYKKQLKKIRQFARENDITDNEINKALQNSFRTLEKKKKKVNFRFFMKSMVTLLFIIIICFISFDKKFLGVMLLRNLQNSIYPGLKLLRKIAVPIIQHYPSLSELYDEWCILENPYFYVNDMDCWPCSVVHFVPDLSSHHISRSFNLGIPYTKTENLSQVYMEDIQQLLWQNPGVFKKDAMRVFSNNKTYRDIQDIMEKNMDLNRSKNLNNHITWRINSMTAGRILRKLFPKPVDTPNWWEQSTERFIIFDEPNSPPYSLYGTTGGTGDQSAFQL